MSVQSESKVLLMREAKAQSVAIEVLVWVGCAGSYDARYRQVMKALFFILDQAGISYAVLGAEEGCSGDPARRAGHEYLFQMQALHNISVLNSYQFKRILTSCPHCFHTLSEEYPALGGRYKVMHHTRYLWELLRQKVITLAPQTRAVTYHDSCYLGRAHGIYEVPRAILRTAFSRPLKEMKQHGKTAMCCGAGGAQLFKEAEKGTDAIHLKRIQQARQTGAKVVATACPFCKLMLMDGVAEKEVDMSVRDVAEIVAEQLKKKP